MLKDNVNDERMRKKRKSEFDKINDLTWEWFLKMRSFNLPLSGCLIQEAARTFSERLNKPNFKASNGWLESFIKTHNVSFKCLNGEAASADSISANDFKNKLTELCSGYSSADIFNCDETGLMYKALPEKSYVQKMKENKGIKIKKDRISILLTVSMLGEKLRPIVIGKSAKPRCFKSININKLPIKWKNNKKAWMTASIFEEYFKDLNKNLRKSNRKILLLLDNCTAHPNLEFSNIKLLFLPPNTTSLIQPLDQGVIRTFKSKYRKFFLRFLIAKVDANIKDPIKEVTLLNAIEWIDKSWNDITDSTIKKCFEKSGFKFDDDILDRNDNDDLTNLIGLIKEKNLVCEMENEEEFINFDNEFCLESISGHENFINEIINESNSQMTELIENEAEELNLNNEDEETEDEQEEQINFKEAFEMIKKLKRFAIEKQNYLSYKLISNVEDEFAELQIESTKNMKQTRITDFFPN